MEWLSVWDLEFLGAPTGFSGETEHRRTKHFRLGQKDLLAAHAVLPSSSLKRALSNAQMCGDASDSRNIANK